MINYCSIENANLSRAVIEKNIDNVSSLLAKGANASSVCISNEISPLILSFFLGEIDILKKLLIWSFIFNYSFC